MVMSMIVGALIILLTAMVWVLTERLRQELAMLVFMLQKLLRFLKIKAKLRMKFYSFSIMLNMVIFCIMERH